MDIKNIVTSSTLLEETQQEIISHYKGIKEYIKNLEEDEIKEVEEADLLGDIEYLIKSFAEHTFLDDLKKEMTAMKSKKEEITILNFRIGDNGLNLIGFGPEDFETFIGSNEVEARTEIQYADVEDQDILTEFINDVDSLIGIYLKEVVDILLTKETLSKWNVTYPISVYYCEDFEEYYAEEDGELLTTLQ